MVFIIYIFIEPRLFYRWEKFELIKQDSYEYQKASERLYFKQKTISVIMTIGKLLLACLAAVFFLFGYSFSYLRSLIDTPEGQCTVKWEQGDELTLDTEDGDTTIALPVETDGDVRIVMKTGRTPFAPQLTIDGNAIEAIGSHHITHWDSKSNILKDYFLQSYTYTIPAADIHDGSILTLTCGEWSYEWAFVSAAP